MSALGRAFVMLHLALHLAYLILQLAARALEGIVERVVDVRITLVILRRAADVDLAAFRQGEVNCGSRSAHRCGDGHSAPSRPRGRR